MLGLLAFNSSGNPPYSRAAAGATFRFSFGFIAVAIAWLAYYRIWRVKGDSTQSQEATAKQNVGAPDACPLH